MSEIIIPPPTGDLSQSDHDYLAEAAAYLERPGFLVRLTNKVGRPAEALIKRLPGPASKIVLRSTDKALRVALRAALFSLPRGQIDVSDQHVRALHAATFQSGGLHSAATYVTGFTGGMLGAPALPIELPATTAIMLRSIADIARTMGADLSTEEARLECLAVFGLGSSEAPGAEMRAAMDDGQNGIETGYYAVRSSLASATQAAAAWATTASPQQVAAALSKGRSSAISRLVAVIASRFSVVVSQKTVLQLLPVLGAATGTATNLAFIDHFNHVARYHFGLRLLEQRYGADVVRGAYQRHALALPAPE
ncbi:MAG: EcsC family protein [Myxococcales bacterium]|nr:EcsC family protein [Myxococcales bacterium]